MTRAEKLASCTMRCTGLMDLLLGAEHPVCTWSLSVDRVVVMRTCVYIVHLSLYCTPGLVLAVLAIYNFLDI